MTEQKDIDQQTAVAKLKEIYEAASSAEDAGDFILSILKDNQLKKWFGKK